ncbi:phenoloxidase-activating factor 2-like [Daktulosphaira vitifoliae]|uniref:phenoloxidase-activating factor 2-like n=1 Tax=Daktulosphaira vitifoliae TaxID=58002 RepID=UPI0021AAE1A0|nr:phenoloxidase-activating factor 2-like [Daktulosphaira vitifoliae]
MLFKYYIKIYKIYTNRIIMYIVIFLSTIILSEANFSNLNTNNSVKFDKLELQIENIKNNHASKISLKSEWLEECKCVITSDCLPKTNDTSIDIRIVTKPDTCPTGMIWCCSDPTIENPLLTCGKISPQNIEGIKIQPDQANFGEFPWQALILTISNSFVSNGALINKKYVLSTAHFLITYSKNISALKIRLGEWDIYRNIEPFPHIERSISSMTIHPDYISSNLHNDIVVIMLSEPVITSTYISPICLPYNMLNFEVMQFNKCRVSGWGTENFERPQYPGILKKVNVPLWSQDRCVENLRTTRLGSKFQLHEGFICAGGEEHEDACTGDGGSPLVCEHDSVTILIGLVSWGIGCGTASVPGVYVDVSKYLPWIENTITTMI